MSIKLTYINVFCILYLIYFRQSTDSYFSDLKDSLVEVGILKDESDYVVRQSTPNFEAWKKDNLYDHMYQDGSPSKLTIITDDED